MWLVVGGLWWCVVVSAWCGGFVCSCFVVPVVCMLDVMIMVGLVWCEVYLVLCVFALAWFLYQFALYLFLFSFAAVWCVLFALCGLLVIVCRFGFFCCFCGLSLPLAPSRLAVANVFVFLDPLF